MPFPAAGSEPAHLYFMARSMAGKSVEHHSSIEWGKSVELPNCKVTVVKFAQALRWGDAKEIIGSGFNLYPIKMPGNMSEYDGAMAEMIIDTLRAAAAGDRGVRLAVANEAKTVFDRQDAHASTLEHKVAGKRTF